MILDDIKTHLSNGGFKTNVFVMNLPTNAPVSYVIIRTYPGAPPLRTSGGVIAERQRIQVEVSDPSGQTANETAEEIKQYLDGTKDVVLNETNYYWIAALGDPVMIGRTEKDYARVVCNFEVMKQQSTV
jgi:hypothetical protein